MWFKIFLSFSLILFLFLNCFVQGQNLPDANTTLTSVSVTAATTTSSETNKSSVLSSCPAGYIDPPKCTACAPNYDKKDDKCLEIKSNSKPSRGTGRRVFLILFACLLTVFLILALLVVYGRLSQQRRRRSPSDQENISNPPNVNTNIRNRFNNILQSIGLNKRGRFNFFSISNNNNSSGQYRQPETSRAHLSENPDEALLFDDPYADAGLHNSSANPYKSLTLAVT